MCVCVCVCVCVYNDSAHGAVKARLMLEDVTAYMRRSNEENGRYAFGAPDYVPRGYTYERFAPVCEGSHFFCSNVGPHESADNSL